MHCPICKATTQYAFTATVLGKHEAQYQVCDDCGYLFAVSPYWLDEAYSSAIASSDTGLIMRNLSIACKLASVLYWGLGERGTGRYLDIAGGYGMLTRLMRDFGFDFYWQDKYCSNVLAAGFEYAPELGPCRAVTAFEVLEHLTNPLAFVRDALHAADSKVMLFSTELYSGAPPRASDWQYYSFPTGQHIGFFQRRTLEIMSVQLGMKFLSSNGIHVFSSEPIHKDYFAFLTGRVAPKFAPIFTRRSLGAKTLDDSQRMLDRVSLTR